MRQTIFSGLLSITILSGCKLVDTDAFGQLPPSVEVANALLVPGPDGIIVFPIGDDPTRPLEDPVGLFADPADIGDMVQRADGNIVCTTLNPDLSEPEGFILSPKGDVLQREDNTLINLDPSPRLITPTALDVFSDNSVVISDFELGNGVERFSAEGVLLGPLTAALSFVNPVGVVVLNDDVIVLDPQQDPRLFRFGIDGAFKGAFAIDTEVLAPLSAVANNGTLFVVDSILSAVFSFDASGNLLEFVAVEGLARPTDVAVLPNGFVAVSDLGDDEIGITPGLRIYGLAGNLVQQITINQLANTNALRIAVVSNITAHPIQ
jgi:hypothetical protein